MQCGAIAPRDTHVSNRVNLVSQRSGRTTTKSMLHDFLGTEAGTHTHTHTRRKMAAVKAILSEACTKLVLLLETVHPCNYSRSELVKPAKITATVGTQCRKKDSELKLQKQFIRIKILQHQTQGTRTHGLPIWGLRTTKKTSNQFHTSSLHGR